MAAENTETRLVTDYEALRRREYTLITDMLEVLPRINNLSEDYTAQVRDALFHADHPYLMVFVGPFSSGKSSLINALLGTNNLLQVGPVPTTDRISILRWGEEPQQMNSGGEVDAVFHPSSLLRKVSFVDTPGLESIFQKHEDITRKFLHRSDVVMLVMLATQAMTQSNVNYLQTLREYGKKINIIINQADLLSPEEQETVRNYVVDQSLDRLGFQPEVWMVSAKQALAARAGDALDEDAWQASGLDQIEKYIDTQLGDADRLRQKLQTPLQIMQNVNTVALTALKNDQAILDKYQGITENIDQQLAAHKREQEKTVREINQEITEKFDAVGERGSEAIREIFQFSRAAGSVTRGLGELTGIARLFRRDDRASYVRLTFEKYKVFEPVTTLPNIVDKLGPRMEGRDLQDIDDLVSYSQEEIATLPKSIREKVIGTVQAPVQYDRRALQDVRADLEALEDEARVVETDNITQTVRNTLLYLALYEVLIIITGIAALASGVGSSQPELLVLLVIFIIGLGMLGLVILPLAGRVVQNRYVNRLLKLQARYIDAVTRASDKQIEYAMRLRRDVVAPLTRLVEAQTEIHTEQLGRLRLAEQEMNKIEGELNKLGRNRLLGIRG